MIEKLERKDLNCNVFSVYDYDGLTMNELLCQFFTKINECVDTSNKAFDLMTWLKEQGLKEEVAKKLNELILDGTIKQLINNEIFNDLNDKIDTFMNETEQQINTKATNYQYNIIDYNSIDELLIEVEKTGGEIILPQGTITIEKPIIISVPGVVIKGVGYKTRIVASNNFVGDSLIIFKTSDGSLCKGNGIENLYIDCNNVNGHGVTVYSAYDMSTWKNFEVRNTNRQYDCIRFLNNDLSSTQISQTIIMENIIAMHFSGSNSQSQIDDENAQGRCFYLKNAQEVTISNCKGFGLNVLKGKGISFELDGCRGVTMLNNSYCFNRIGVKINSENRACNGIFINSSTIEQLSENFIQTSGTIINKTDSIYIDGIRVQNSETLINLNYVNNSIINSGLCNVSVNDTSTNNTIISLDDTKVVNNGVRCSVIGLTNANNRGIKIPLIDFTDVYNLNTRILNLNPSPGVNSVGIMLYVNTDGTKSLKQVSIGAIDTGGSGYRVLRVPN